MSIPWANRKARLLTLLSADDEDEDAASLALDRILHGQSVIGKTSKTRRIDSLRFTEEDLYIVGTLEYGQFAIIDIVSCKLDGRVYVRKSIEKRLALRTRDQCSPQIERDLLLGALRTRTQWAPHILCAYQTDSHLNIVMQYADGGTLWDVLESSPLDGRITESDIQWWAPQIVSAIHWCHSQGFVHRDIKPHNFVLKSDARLAIIDFGSAAPLLPLHSDGSQQVPKRHCLVPCGTCDYISPEILQAHEAALVALEMSDEPVNDSRDDVIGGYGRETDWWSLGAMLYEMAYGMAPFFAKDIRQTYLKIMDHNKSLKFDLAIDISKPLEDLLRRFLTDAELRLGKCGVKDIQDHPFFAGAKWGALHHDPPSLNLHLPQFTYSTPVAPPQAPVSTELQSLSESQSTSDLHSSQPKSQSYSQGFAFSAFFQSSSATSSLGPELVRVTPQQPTNRSIMREQTVASFIGFSWGPTKDAFTSCDVAVSEGRSALQDTVNTPRPLRHTSVPLTPHTLVPPTPGFGSLKTMSTPGPSNFQQLHPFVTPVRPNAFSPYDTLPRTGTVRRTAPRRAVSDREAMKQLVDCVGMSARKKVLESGRKPKVLNKFGSVGSKTSSTVKELRFDRSVMVMNDTGVSFRLDPAAASSCASSMSLGSGPAAASTSTLGASVNSSSGGGNMSLPRVIEQLATLSHDEGGYDDQYNTTFIHPSDSDSSFVSEDIPPSPSPSPRPGSAMSSRRSQTPTITGSYLLPVNGTISRNGEAIKNNYLTPLLPVDGTLSRPPSALQMVAPPHPPESRPKANPPRPIPPPVPAAPMIEEKGVRSEGTSRGREDMWNELEERHVKLMREIADLNGRLTQVIKQIGRT